MRLKPNTMYALPDGRELVARPGMEGEYFLHDPGRGVASAPVYIVNESGQVLSWGRDTHWTEQDLHETGRTSKPEIERLRLL